MHRAEVCAIRLRQALAIHTCTPHVVVPGIGTPSWKRCIAASIGSRPGGGLLALEPLAWSIGGTAPRADAGTEARALRHPLQPVNLLLPKNGLI